MLLQGTIRKCDRGLAIKIIKANRKKTVENLKYTVEKSKGQ